MTGEMQFKGQLSAEEFEDLWEEAIAGRAPMCPDCGFGKLVDSTGNGEMQFMRFSCGHTFAR